MPLPHGPAAFCTLWLIATLACSAGAGTRHNVPREHPRLLGSRAELTRLAKTRASAYGRMARTARKAKAGDHEQMISMAIVAAVEQDRALGRKAVLRALKYVDGPIRKGHQTFGHDLALCAIVYDLCHGDWQDSERKRFHVYMNKTVDANVRSETHVFHNGWYGYKHWGIGLACYATYYENPRARDILAALRRDYVERAAPALALAGDGGGWAEGYYIHYWLYDWLFFCEVARRCEGVDYYADAPGFYRQRALASAFEMYPGIGIYTSRRPVPMGDGGGRGFGGDRDKAFSAWRILVNAFRDDPVHQVVHAFNETTPRSAVGDYAYKDFLWRDDTVPKRPLTTLPLSHISLGAGHVYARSSWDEGATYFFFKCSDRFTAHQHLDVGHFVIYKYTELAGDGGHYDGFGTPHDVNYHLRTIAHSTILVRDPSETWPGIRAGRVTGNDGGQHHAWPHHNGAVVDPAAWQKGRKLYDIADILAFEDKGTYLYVAGDGTRAYSPKKLERFTRQIVFLRPDTFVIFDRVRAAQPAFRKTWLLQAMKTPERRGQHWVITNGKGRLFVQTLLPEKSDVRLASGPDLYRYDGKSYPPSRDTGPAPECRIEVSPSRPAADDVFLHVLTAADATRGTVPAAMVQRNAGTVEVTIGATRVRFSTKDPGGSIVLGGESREFTDKVVTGTSTK